MDSTMKNTPSSFNPLKEIDTNSQQFLEVSQRTLMIHF
jgi:hypothetical protein